MRTFEIGKRYRDGAATFEIIGRTAKTVRFVMIQHAGHFNERKGDEKRAKVNNWDQEMRMMYCICWLSV